MRVRIEPGGAVGGVSGVPGDKSIAHRWLILAATASGESVLGALPPSLDVRATARCLAQLSMHARPMLEDWSSSPSRGHEHKRFTWDGPDGDSPQSTLIIEAEGRAGLRTPTVRLDCGNSGTTMRLLAGIVAAAPLAATLSGDASLRARPMERIAQPLRDMGASVVTSDGRPPIEIRGGRLRGIHESIATPSAQVKGCILFAGLAAEGQTTVEEQAPTRDHTERALAALGAPVSVAGLRVMVSAFQHEGFEASVPGDLSSAAFLVAAAALTGSEILIRGVGLNPTRTRFLDVMERMGVRTERRVLGEELSEPVGDLFVHSGTDLVGTTVGPEELSLVIDEVPVLAVLAAHGRGESWFQGAAELRLKETDRLNGLAEGIRGLGGSAGVEGDGLVVAGEGLDGGAADARGDHRMAMALAVGALGAQGDSVIEGMEWAEVSFPEFVTTLVSLGARIG